MKQNKLDKPCNKDLSIFFTEREYQDKKEKEEKKEPDKMSENDSNMVSKTDKIPFKYTDILEDKVF